TSVATQTLCVDNQPLELAGLRLRLRLAIDQLVKLRHAAASEGVSDASEADEADLFVAEPPPAPAQASRVRQLPRPQFRRRRVLACRFWSAWPSLAIAVYLACLHIAVAACLLYSSASN
ncbi:hypothetical protein BOX15_Mlig032115g1, partial [Macrostomum lignano]